MLNLFIINEWTRQRGDKSVHLYRVLTNGRIMIHGVNMTTMLHHSLLSRYAGMPKVVDGVRGST